MQRLILLVALLAVPFTRLVGQDVCQALSGATIVADDGEYLGKVTSQYDHESIFNEYGTFGSPYSSKSIWNEYGKYGGKYSAQSPFNPYSTTPPAILKRGQVIAYLTVNRALEGAVNPYALRSCEFV